MEKQAIYGILFNQENTEVLLVQRRDLPVWVLPGGGLDPGELPEDGVVREVFEETGYIVEIVRKIAIYLPVNKMTQKTHVFECKIIEGVAKPNAEAKQIQFFPIKKLPSRLPPPFPGWIRDASSKYPSVLIKNTEDVNYWTLTKLLIQHPYLVIRYFLTKIGIRFNDTK
jgi:8-oxo-dGTP pyrophosphatase MutT (NUDIX family)